VRLGVLALATAVAAGGAAWAAEEPDVQAALFRYDATADLKIEESGVRTQGTVAIHDIQFAPIPGRDPVKAFLVVPQGPGPFAGILWVHWLGEPATTNRTQFLEEATALAPRGIVSLLVDAMWSAPDWYGHRDPDQDYDGSIRQVIALRRAMDLLASRPGVDKARLGFVGHDYGGMYGMLMAGADRRARTYVFVAVAPSLNNWAFFARQPASKADYLRKNAVLELTDSLRRVTNASTLFQFARNDAYIARADTGVPLAAASAPKERRLYDADHSMAVPQAVSDRDAWLLKELGLGGPGLPPLPSPSPKAP